MSVKVADRGESKTEYIEAARVLAVKVGKVMGNAPHKYKASFGDHMIKTALDIYGHLQVAQSVYVVYSANAEQDYAQRRGHLKEAEGLINHISATARVYFGIVVDCDSYDKEKALRQQHSIGDMCSRLAALVDGTIEWDSTNIRKIRRKAQASGAVDVR